VTPGPISQKVVAAKSEMVREMLAGIRTLPLGSEREFRADPRMVAAGESYLRRGIEALIDLGRHILARGFGKPVPEYAEVAAELGRLGVLDPAVAARLRLMARYRNRLVHFYDEVTPAELYRILSSELADIDEALAGLLSWTAHHPEQVDTSL
jgi:uncharacterized protein YutE (UPF0331/DUF86 family)